MSALCIVNKCLLWSQGYAVVVWYCKSKMTGVGNVCGPMRHVAMCEFGRGIVIEVSTQNLWQALQFELTNWGIRCSIVASIPACHAGDRGSIPRDGDTKRVYFPIDIYNLVR